MIIRLAILWIAGLVTLVPYGTYYLFYKASRDEYALLISLVLFWIFGYWSVVGPLVTAYKIRKIMKAIESATSGDQFREILLSQDSREVAIDLIASENHVPKFVARRIYGLLVKRLSIKGESSKGNR